MNEFQPLIDLLSGKFGWLTTVIVWIGALRVPMKIFNGWIQQTLTAFVARVAASPEQDDDEAVRRIIGSLPYRFIAFILDAVLSLKLPTAESLANHKIESVRGSLAVTLLFCAGLLAGCGTLNPEGPYGGDKALYDADSTITMTYDALHAFVKWEYENRAALASMPEIKHHSDTIRKQAPQWFNSAVAIRDAYQQAPSAGTRDALMSSLAVLRQAMTEATRFYIRAGPSRSSASTFVPPWARALD